MGENQCRSVGLSGEEENGRSGCGRGIRRRWNRGLLLAAGMLIMAAVPGQGPIPARASAQEPPVNDAAATKPVAPQASAPSQALEEPAPLTAEALSLRYRFIEKYSATEDPAHPELITQYRVGVLETQKTVREKAQGAPEQSEISHSTIYTERVAQVAKLGDAMSAVRHYDKFKMKGMATTRPPNPPLFVGLTIWLRRQTGAKHEVLSLTDDRPLRELEYGMITRQVFLPQLTTLFPPTPKRVADTWPISPKAAQYLVGELPDAEDYEMTGTLVEVRKASSGPTLTAVIDISGQMNLSFGLSALRAQLHFAFDPAPVAAASPKAADGPTAKSRDRTAPGTVDARGKITRVRMLWAVSDVIPDTEGRRKQTTTYDLNLERQFPSPATEVANGPNAALTVPTPLPTADESNSWLVHDDPQGRFHFLHPQGLTLTTRLMDSTWLEFAEDNPGIGQDVFLVRIPPGNADPKADRSFRDPEQFQREADAFWAKQKVETLRGPSGWLPEADWAPWKVYRKELGVKTEGADDGGKSVQRIYIDFYLVLSSKGNECFQVQSMTVRNDHVAFRSQVEGIIKSFHFGPWDGKRNAKAATPTPLR